MSDQSETDEAAAKRKKRTYAGLALIAWTVGYGRYQKRQGDRLAAAYAAAAAKAETEAEAGTETDAPHYG